MRDTLTRLKQRIESSDSLNQDDQQTLLSLIGELEFEADDLQQHPASGKVCESIDAAGAASEESGDDDDGVGLLETLQPFHPRNRSVSSAGCRHLRPHGEYSRSNGNLSMLGIPKPWQSLVLR